MSRATRGAYRRIRRLQDRGGAVQRLTDRTMMHGCCRRVGCNRRGFLTLPAKACNRCMEQLVDLRMLLGWWFSKPEVDAQDQEDEGYDGRELVSGA